MININFNDEDMISNVLKKRFRGNIEFYKEMVNLFFETNAEKIDIINRAIKSGDTKEIKFSAHYIKGGASNLGAERIRQIAEILEMQDNIENGPQKNTELLQDLKTEMKNFRERVNQLK